MGDTEVAPVICSQDIGGEAGVDERSVALSYAAMNGKAAYCQLLR